MELILLQGKEAAEMIQGTWSFNPCFIGTYSFTFIIFFKMVFLQIVLILVLLELILLQDLLLESLKARIKF